MYRRNQIHQRRVSDNNETYHIHSYCFVITFKFFIQVTDADKITMVEAVGQSMFFFAAGQETTASAITYCLYELSFNHDIQEKLYNEISQVAQSPEGLTYEKLFDMPYLDMVFQGFNSFILYYISIL